MKLDKLPETIDPSLNLEQVRQECRRLVKKRSFISAGVATVPVPFFDVVVDAGATCVAQPGGSMRDQEVIDAANERGVAMVFTGVRHFRH